MKKRHIKKDTMTKGVKLLAKGAKTIAPIVLVPLARKAFDELKPHMIYSVAVGCDGPFVKELMKHFPNSSKRFMEKPTANGDSTIRIEPDQFGEAQNTSYTMYRTTILRLRSAITETSNKVKSYNQYLECLNNPIDRSALEDFVKEIHSISRNYQDIVFDKDTGMTRVRTVDDGYNVDQRHLRTFNDVFIKPDIEDLIKSNLDNFIQQKSWYIKHNIPYHFGIMLYGLPGTGKSSLTQAITRYVNGVPFYIPAECVSDIRTIMRNAKMDIPDSSGVFKVFIFEDLDCVMDELMGTESSNDEIEYAIYDPRTARTRKKSRRTGLATVLNCLDGINACENCIYIFTTNNIDKFADPAFLRPGRIDLQVEIPPVDNSTFVKFLESHFGKVSLPKGYEIKTNTTCSQLQLDVMNGMTSDEIINKYKKVNRRKGSAKNETSSN